MEGVAKGGRDGKGDEGQARYGHPAREERKDEFRCSWRGLVTWEGTAKILIQRLG